MTIIMKHNVSLLGGGRIRRTLLGVILVLCVGYFMCLGSILLYHHHGDGTPSSIGTRSSSSTNQMKKMHFHSISTFTMTSGVDHKQQQQQQHDTTINTSKSYLRSTQPMRLKDNGSDSTLLEADSTITSRSNPNTKTDGGSSNQEDINQTPKNKQSNNHKTTYKEGMAACLLIKDENHRLSEWLAYHYTVLPLRRIVVAVDPDSVTSPKHILQRWSDLSSNTTTNNQSVPQLSNPLTATLWEDDDYLTPLEKDQLYYNYQCRSKTRYDVEQYWYVQRQKYFISRCADQLYKEQQYKYVVFIDTDEYMTYNTLPGAADPSSSPHQNDAPSSTTITKVKRKNRREFDFTVVPKKPFQNDYIRRHLLPTSTSRKNIYTFVNFDSRTTGGTSNSTPTVVAVRNGTGITSTTTLHIQYVDLLPTISSTTRSGNSSSTTSTATNSINTTMTNSTTTNTTNYYYVIEPALSLAPPLFPKDIVEKRRQIEETRVQQKQEDPRNKFPTENEEYNFLMDKEDYFFNSNGDEIPLPYLPTNYYNDYNTSSSSRHDSTIPATSTVTTTNSTAFTSNNIDGTTKTVKITLKKHYTLSPCIPMTRLLFGAKEDNNEEEIITPWYKDQKQYAHELMHQDEEVPITPLFETLRFIHHAKPSDFKLNKWGKVMIDLSRVSSTANNTDNPFDYETTMHHDRGSIHKPFEGICDYRYIAYEDSLLRVQHYVGSFESYSSRTDSRRTKETYEQKGFVNDTTSEHILLDAVSWIPDFVKALDGNKDVARYLLQGVGGSFGYGKYYVDPQDEETNSGASEHQDRNDTNEGSNFSTVTRSSTSTTNSCALLFYYGGHDITKVSWDETILPSIETNLIDANPTCDVYVHWFNNNHNKNVTNDVNATINGSTMIHMNELMALALAQKNQVQRYNEKKAKDDEAQKPETIMRNIQLDDADPLIVKNLLEKRYDLGTTTNTTFIDSPTLFQKWISLEQIWKLVMADETMYDMIGLFPLHQRYVHPVTILHHAAASKNHRRPQQQNKINNGLAHRREHIINQIQHQPLIVPSSLLLPLGQKNKITNATNDGIIFGPWSKIERWMTIDRFKVLKHYHEQEYNISGSTTKLIDSNQFNQYLVQRKLLHQQISPLHAMAIGDESLCAHHVISPKNILTSDCRCEELSKQIKARKQSK